MAKTTMLPPRKVKRYGYIPDLPDHRDFVYSAHAEFAGQLPPSVDLRPHCSKVEDQGSLGSCTANALVGNMEFLEKRQTNLSRLFVYYNERVVEGTVGEDSGAMLRDGVKVLNKLGVCAESSWPYRVSRFTAKPTPTSFHSAKTHCATSYQRLTTLDSMKRCLAAGFPFVFGFTVYESFESQEVADTGDVPMPNDEEQVVGGHAVMAVGYDDAHRGGDMLVRNSWGEDWGQQGYFWMPYDYVSSRDLSDDFWTIRSQGKVT